MLSRQVLRRRPLVAPTVAGRLLLLLLPPSAGLGLSSLCDKSRLHKVLIGSDKRDKNSPTQSWPASFTVCVVQAYPPHERLDCRAHRPGPPSASLLPVSAC